jgi:hypothetical protein
LQNAFLIERAALILFGIEHLFAGGGVAEKVEDHIFLKLGSDEVLSRLRFYNAR